MNRRQRSFARGVEARRVSPPCDVFTAEKTFCAGPLIRIIRIVERTLGGSLDRLAPLLGAERNSAQYSEYVLRINLAAIAIAPGRFRLDRGCVAHPPCGGHDW